MCSFYDSHALTHNVRYGLFFQILTVWFFRVILNLVQLQASCGLLAAYSTLKKLKRM